MNKEPKLKKEEEKAIRLYAASCCFYRIHDKNRLMWLKKKKKVLLVGGIGWLEVLWHLGGQNRLKQLLTCAVKSTAEGRGRAKMSLEIEGLFLRTELNKHGV